MIMYCDGVYGSSPHFWDSFDVPWKNDGEGYLANISIYSKNNISQINKNNEQNTKLLKRPIVIYSQDILT